MESGIGGRHDDAGNAPDSNDVAGSIAELLAALDAQDYLADEPLATAIFLALRMRRPLLLEGDAGVGKTEVAKTLARLTGGELIRLQCYEGIDVTQAVYEWDHARQLLHLRANETARRTTATATAGVPGSPAADLAADLAADRAAEKSADLEDELYDERFLIRRALLRAIEPGHGPPPVLLIDEVDRADDEFEAFLLEVLSDWSITIPELGTVVATEPPIVIITSNRTRDVHDALKRRCLYHWVEHPDFDRELAIVQRRVPRVTSVLARQVAGVARALRDLQLYKAPGVAETIDWATALTTLGCTVLDAAMLEATMGTVVKYREDQERVRAAGLDELLVRASAGGGG